jgi:hypothetical protein
MFKKLAIGLCCTALLWILPAVGDQWDKKTTVTFSAPVELPNIVLPAGTYVFRLLDSPQNRHVVQVFNVEENHIYTTILAIPNYRLTSTPDTVMRFAERKRDKPEALRAWFYPADTFGQEFVYPRQRATELAEATHVPVLMAPVKPAEKAEQLIQEPVMAITPERKEVELAQVTSPAPAEAPRVIAQAQPPAAPTELPKTASPLPLLILVGGCSLGLAGALKWIARHAA